MFDSLADRLSDIFRRLNGRGRLSRDDVEEGLREVRRALLEADVNFKVARGFVDRLRERAVGAEVLESLTPGQQIVKIVNDELVSLLGSERRTIRYQAKPPTVILLAGLQGSGKTTTAAKLGLAVRREGHRPLLVAADIYRPAAAQQLERLGRDNQLPVALPVDGAAPPQLCRRGVDEARRLNCDVVVLDTAGRLQIDERMLAELADISARVDVHETLLVVDAMTGQEAVNVARAFDQAVGLDGVVLTKLDGDARGGAALSMREAIGKPIMYCGIGERPSDLEPFQPDRMASRILGMGDVLTLIERAQSQVDASRAEQAADRLLAGTFTMDDWLEQMRQLRRMGSLEGLLAMIPGGRRALQRQSMPTERDLCRAEAVVLSMTPAERVRPEIINGSRRRRIADGSGTTLPEVNRLLKGFEQTRTLFKSLGKPGRGGRGRLGQLGELRDMQKAMRDIDPSLLVR